MIHRWAYCFILLLLLASPPFIRAQTIDKIFSLTIASTINPAILNYLQTGFQRAQEEGAGLIIIKLRTPGGSISMTKEILSLFGQSEIPIVVWVTPEGSSAASAGAILASGAHVLLMSQGTNIGAATPVQLSGGGLDTDMRSKAVNDLVALVQSLAETRKRNTKLFAEMVEKASSFRAKEAKEKQLIDGIVNNQEELIQFLRGFQIHLRGKDINLDLASHVEVVEHNMSKGQELLNIFADPGFAYVLFLIGAALIYLELQIPGGFIPGALGTLFLILSSIGLQVLPLNFVALGLIILAFTFFIVEIFITSYGILSILGLCSLIFGSLFLYSTDDSYLTLNIAVIFAAIVAVLVCVGLFSFLIVKERRHIGSVKFNAIVGKRGKVIAARGKIDGQHWSYQIQIGGELWNALSTKTYNPGDFCLVKEQNDLILKI